METLSDEQLMARLQSGDDEALRLLIRRYEARMWTFCGSYCRWDRALAEELVQQVFIRVYEQRHKYKKARPFRPWFFTLARNNIINHLNKLKRERRMGAQMSVEPAGLEMGPEDELMQKERVRELDSLLVKLSPKQREIIHMVRQGFEYREISRITGFSETDVRTSLMRGLRTMKRTCHKKGR